MSQYVASLKSVCEPAPQIIHRRHQPCGIALISIAQAIGIASLRNESLDVCVKQRAKRVLETGDRIEGNDMRYHLANRHCLSVKRRDDISRRFQTILCQCEPALKVRRPAIDDGRYGRFEVAFKHRNCGYRKVAKQLGVTIRSDALEAAIELYQSHIRFVELHSINTAKLHSRSHALHLRFDLCSKSFRHPSPSVV